VLLPAGSSVEMVHEDGRTIARPLDGWAVLPPTALAVRMADAAPVITLAAKLHAKRPGSSFLTHTPSIKADVAAGEPTTQGAVPCRLTAFDPYGQQIGKFLSEPGP